MKKALCLTLALLLMIVSIGCGKSSVTEPPNMETIFAFMSEHLPNVTPFDAESVFDAYGIDPATCNQEVVVSHYDGSEAAELWMIEAVDKAAAKTIAKLAQQRLDSMGEQFRTYDATAFALVEKAELFTHGNCVVLIVSQNVETLLELYKTAAELA